MTSQFIAVGLITAGGYAVLGWTGAYSLLLGGLICAIPNAYFAVKAFQYRGARAAQKIVRAFYLGETIKLLMMSAGFLLSFIFVEPLNTLALFAGFILVYLAGLMALMKLRTGK